MPGQRDLKDDNVVVIGGAALAHHSRGLPERLSDHEHWKRHQILQPPDRRFGYDPILQKWHHTDASQSSGTNLGEATHPAAKKMPEKPTMPAATYMPKPGASGTNLGEASASSPTLKLIQKRTNRRRNASS